MRILVIEDDARTGAFVRRGLLESGFAVDVAADGAEGLHLAQTAPYDVVVLDVMLPGMDGFAVLRSLRGAGFRTPVLMLSARGEVDDRVRGLHLGADDYLVKPFAFSELLARINAILRRGEGAGERGVYRAADLLLEVSPRRCSRAGRRLDLTPKEFSLLELFLRHKGEVLTRTFIAERVWDMNLDRDTHVVDLHIRRLRSKVDDPFEPKLVKTVRGVGYVLKDAPADGQERLVPLAARLAIAYAIGIAALAIASFVAVDLALTASLEQDLDRLLAEEADDLRAALDAPDSRPALAALVARREADKARPRVLVRVLSADGSLVAGSTSMARELPANATATGAAEGSLAAPPVLAPARGSRVSTSGDWWEVERRVERRGAEEYVLDVAVERSGIDRLNTLFRGGASGVLLATVAAGALLAYVTARRGVRPIELVTATARRVGAQSAGGGSGGSPALGGERIDPTGAPREVRELAETFNAMLERLDGAFRRLKEIGADLAHELRTPVHALRGEAEVALLRERTPEEYREILSGVLSACDRLGRLIDDVLLIEKSEGRPDLLLREDVDVAAELEGLRETFEAFAEERGVTLEGPPASPAPILVAADRSKLRRALANLVQNAIRYTDRGGRVSLAARIIGPEGAAEGHVEVEVRDTGVGIAREHLERVFERFYRVDPARGAGGGAGLGLAIVRAIVRAHGGDVVLESDPGRGTRALIRLPRQDPRASPAT